MTTLIPQSFIDDLLQRTDLVELIDSFLPLKKRGNSYQSCCPFHNEKTPSFHVVPKKQFYHCFGCGESGNAISFLMRHLNQGFVEAIENLATRLGLTVPTQIKTKQAPSKDLYLLLSQITQYYQQQLKNHIPAIQYLKSRGVNGETARYFQLGYAPKGWHDLETRFKSDQKNLISTGMLVQNKENIYSRYRDRIIFPIHDRQGRVIGFGGRTIDEEQKPKYLNSPETDFFKKNRELYGLYQVLQHQKNDCGSILVVEGYLDVVALAQYGIYHAVATLGTATGSYHIQLLIKYTKRILFCFDGDGAGKQAAWRALENSLPHMNTGLDIGFVFLPEGHDPDSLVRLEGKNLFLQRLDKALPLHRFFFETLSKNLALSTPAGKTQFIQATQPYLANMADGAYKHYLIEDLAKLTRIESHRLQQLLAQKNAPSPLPQMPIKRTPLRIATALLLQHPEIYRSCKDNIQIQAFDSPSLQILKQLLEAIAASPQTNTASLVELWRDTPWFEPINKLAVWDHQVPEAALMGECLDTLLFLEKQNLGKQIDQLIEKSRQNELSIQEKLTLQKLLKIRGKQ